MRHLMLWLISRPDMLVRQMADLYPIDSRRRVTPRNDLPPVSPRGPRVAIVNVSVAFGGYKRNEENENGEEDDVVECRPHCYC